jgi:hypothetical protein
MLPVKAKYRIIGQHKNKYAGGKRTDVSALTDTRLPIDLQKQGSEVLLETTCLKQ